MEEQAMLDDRPIRGAVSHADWFNGTIHLHLGYRVGRGEVHAIETLGGEGIETTVRVAEGEEAPTLVIREDTARALLDVLTQHFGGTSNVQQLRKDYDAERDRVDKLIQFAITPPTVEYRTEVH
jgi:hypothetical protein